MAVPTGISPGINPATSSPVSWGLPDFNFSDPLGVGDTLSSYERRVSVDPNSQVSIGGTEIPYGPSGNIDHDLVEHYYNSQQLAQDYGRPTSALLGALHEVRNAFDPQSTGLSPDDLLANYAGWMGFSPEEAAQANVWDHTQDEGSGYDLFRKGGFAPGAGFELASGQGSWGENWQKLRNLGLPESSFPFVRGLVNKIAPLDAAPQSSVSQFYPQIPNSGDSWFKRALARLVPGGQGSVQAASLAPEEGGYYGRGIGQPTQPIPLPAQPLYPTLTPDTPLRQHRQPHYPKWSLPGELGPQDDFSGVQWIIPELTAAEKIKQLERESQIDQFDPSGFIAPPVPSAPSGIHVESGVPPQTPRVVGGDEDQVSEIKSKPRAKRTSVEEQVVVASEVRKALDNAAKGKKVKNEFRAITELAKTDPTIARRYTTPGSQDLIDITSQVESFASINKPRPGYGKPPRRPGGR